MFSSKIQFLEKLLGKCKFSHNTKEAEFYCCFCFHHKKKLSINIETDNFKCWVCNKSGKNLLFLIKKTGNSLDVEKYLKNYKAKNVTISSTDSAESTFSLTLPESFEPLIHCLNTVYGQRAVKYLNRRGVTEDDILFYKIGVSPTGQMQDRVIIPSFDKDGELNFYTTRAIVNGYMNHWAPSVPDGYKASCVFNELNIDWQKPVTIVEGFFDAFKAKNAIPLLGSSLNHTYSAFQKIVHNESSVILALDADATDKMHRIGKLLLSYKIDVKVLDVAPFKDVGEMSREDFEERFSKAAKFTEDFSFRSKLARIICQ